MSSIYSYQPVNLENTFQTDIKGLDNSVHTDLIINSNISKYSEIKIQEEIKIPKILKEIDGCSLDTSSVVGRTRKRKFSYNSEENQTENIHFNTKDISVNVKNISEEKKLGTKNFDNKENSLVKFPLKKPKKIMKLCKSKLIEYLTEIPEIKNSEPDRTDEMDRKIKRSGVLSFKCKKCSEKFDSASQLNTHYYMHDFDSQNNDLIFGQTDQIGPSAKRIKLSHKCNQCSQECGNAENLAAHVAEHHKDGGDTLDSDKKMSVAETGGDSVEKHKCLHCGDQFSLLKRLHFHQATSCSKAQASLIKFLQENNLGHFGCSICAKNFKNQDEVQIHKNLKHPKLKPLARRR